MRKFVTRFLEVQLYNIYQIAFMYVLIDLLEELQQVDKTQLSPIAEAVQIQPVKKGLKHRWVAWDIGKWEVVHPPKITSKAAYRHEMYQWEREITQALTGLFNLLQTIRLGLGRNESLVVSPQYSQCALLAVKSKQW